VSRWQSGNMVLRWAAAAYLDTEKRFYRIMGNRDPWMLKAMRDRGDASGIKRNRLAAMNRSRHVNFQLKLAHRRTEMRELITMDRTPERLESQNRTYRNWGTMVLTLVAAVLLMAVLGMLPSGTKAAEGEREECIERLEATKEFMMDVRYDYGEWYISPLVWSGFTYEEKETLVRGLSHCRKVVKGYGRIVVKDGYSGEKLGEMGVTGPKIYK